MKMIWHDDIPPYVWGAVEYDTLEDFFHAMGDYDGVDVRGSFPHYTLFTNYEALKGRKASKHKIFGLIHDAFNKRLKTEGSNMTITSVGPEMDEAHWIDFVMTDIGYTGTEDRELLDI